ncbi:oligoendopeptidase F [Desemzia sp. RIT804]|uniref:oligoendopeptidase F n=1 Tax=Desemzia sp. RIT 804 TaxID=2810209 RepID=UPI001952823B|nr:oligoendopeptidase F [Desemzia sp. RIT 804]MBM6614768.1 oligoendopeptidase F [Desemzia sp. RIT 804]
MSEKGLQLRSEVPEQMKWDITAIYKSRAEFDAAVEATKGTVEDFVQKYEGQLTTAQTISAAIKDYESLLQTQMHLNYYAYLPVSADISDPSNMELYRWIGNLIAEWSAQLSFFDSELVENETAVLDQVAKAAPEYTVFIEKIKDQKEIQLAPAVEKALAQLQPTLGAPQSIFEQIRSSDMDFGTFTVDGKDYPLSFVLYEDYYMYHPDTAIRRAAFEQFSTVLGNYQNTMAETYYTQLQKEKTLATMRGFDSIFDYLLYNQNVDKELYDRQIDVIMKDLAPVMQKYITHVKEENGLDKMTYADIKIDLDHEFAPTVTVEESKELVQKAISVLGQDYVDMIMRAYPERWVDFAQNKGKRSGAFCASVYGLHPYVLMSWTDQLSDVYTLLHELGHAGQGILSGANNTILAARMSLYLIEAPSTFNELLLTDSLKKESEDPRMERFALTRMISKTYFHNYITHLLEAAYQREVYKLIDAGQGFDAAKLSELKRAVLEEFWGDAVEINEGAELTWMRQIHYYMGLYSYTYSAGLTIATQAFLRVKEEGQPAVTDWLKFLTLGGQLKPIEAAKVAGVDITTSKPLDDTIQYLNDSVNRIITLTNEMK